jgi:hypothetical protein
MVVAVRSGASQHQAAHAFGVALSTVQLWLSRAEGRRLDRVDWNDLSRRPKVTQRTARSIEDRVLRLRRELRVHSDLGEFGARAIHEELQRGNFRPDPSIRTIGRILERRGALDGQRRVRRLPPPRGWYLPAVASGETELDSFDTIEGLLFAGGAQLVILTGISLHGALPAAWCEPYLTARRVITALTEHWGEAGLPAYAQFDNDNRFQGPHQNPDSIGRVIRLCLRLDVVPVFAPPRESGFQAAIESFNGRWQAKVWSRFGHGSLRSLRYRSARYIAAARRRSAVRIESAPARRPFPARFHLDLQAPPRGSIIFLRRTDDKGRAHLLGHNFPVNRHWPHRLVRAEVDLTADLIRFYALRRREPSHQPLLCESHYQLPARPFRE